jgi:Winged helix-turn helix
VAEPVRVREIDDDEGRRLLRIIRRGSGSVVTWRRAQMVLLSAQGMLVAKIAEVTFTSPDRVRDVIHNFNADGFDSLYPKYKGGWPRTFTLPEAARSRRSPSPGRLSTACRFQRSRGRNGAVPRCTR